jgi:DNA-binding XRE family transcriptional regulator
MVAVTDPNYDASPVGTTAAAAARRRAASSAAYRAQRARLQPYEAIARQVIALRARHGLTQEQLAERVGTSHSQISRVETGQHKTSVETLRRIADAFDAQLVVSFETRGDGRVTPSVARAGA